MRELRNIFSWINIVCALGVFMFDCEQCYFPGKLDLLAGRAIKNIISLDMRECSFLC